MELTLNRKKSLLRSDLTLEKRDKSDTREKVCMYSMLPRKDKEPDLGWGVS
jgi:hypothetical protein